MYRRLMYRNSWERLEPGLNAGRKRAEIVHALHFVVGQLDAEMLLDAGEHFEGLQAIDSEFLEKVIVWRERFPRHLKLRGREVEYLVGRLVEGWHKHPYNLF
jgi:hypothetical protein